MADTLPIWFKISLGLLLAALCACSVQERPTRLFTLVPVEASGVSFRNTLHYTYEFNVYRYRNYYNGGGTAIGDINGDGRPDLFMVGNQVPNRLYLNMGDFVFEDITEAAGVTGQRAWSTGVTMADINGDGWLDLYVCNSGIVEGDDKRNELYINLGDGTFAERAEEYGLDDEGLSIHGSFFDYDLDGDLDLYLVNNSYRNIQSFDLAENTRHIRDRNGGDRLYRNTGGGSFKDVTEEAGIHSSEIGFGLGVSAGDVNRDGWTDMYISNDFFERDYLYLNGRNGAFTELLEQGIRSVSAAAMGADMADLDGDGFPEIFVTDMLPRDEQRVKTVTSFDSWDRYRNYVKDDYFHQFTRNTLHRNRGAHSVTPVHFSEVGRMAGIEASDWSWGALIADFNLDGDRDVFVANGVYQDLTDADYLVDVRSEETLAELISEDSVDFRTLIDMIPSRPISNYMFAGRGGMQFTESAEAFGLSQPGFSNGSAYGDLDLDGDLDLVTNNLNMDSFVYENRATDVYPERAWLRVVLAGPPPNTFAVGAQVTAWHNGRAWYSELQPARGFQSSVEPVLHFGFGEVTGNRLDSLVVQWPYGTETRVMLPETRSTLRLHYSESQERSDPVSTPTPPALLQPVDPTSIGLGWRHAENRFSDFDQQPLLFHMRSTEGPPICSGDFDGDQVSDLYVGGAKDQPGTIFLRRSDRFVQLSLPALNSDHISEDTDCVWFDADGDGFNDLYVASGGSELPASSSALLDRLYMNERGTGLRRSEQVFASGRTGFEPTGAIAVADIDNDEDIDLFVGARLKPFAYGLPADGHLLLNNGSGSFREATDTWAPELREAGMITGAQWVDIDNDDDVDLLVSSEWKPLLLYRNENGRLHLDTRDTGLETTSGWWQSIMTTDMDGDGDQDIVAGNHGLNSRFRASIERPVHVWVSDFDRNGSVEQVFAWYLDGKLYPAALRHDLVEQIPPLVLKYPTYASYAGQTVYDIFASEQLAAAVHHQATELRSMIGWNDGDGRFTLEALPDEAQLAPMYGMAVLDVDLDGTQEVLMGGNLYEAKPEVGRYDASYGTALGYDATIGMTTVDGTGFWTNKPIRSIITLPGYVIVGANNNELHVFSQGE